MEKLTKTINSLATQALISCDLFYFQITVLQQEDLHEG
jgi:hypothetical protein